MCVCVCVTMCESEMIGMLMCHCFVFTLYHNRSKRVMNSSGIHLEVSLPATCCVLFHVQLLRSGD